jgi:membrane peptidoglycan carboxypeptidase
MIENLHLVPKERMFEVYLNIIEWGPGVYGIKPAAKFYFNKMPNALTLSESIFLSSIIPRPKGFRYAFVSNGEMAGYYPEYCKLLSSIMLRRNQITTEDSAKLKPFVILTGAAKKYLAIPDTLHLEDSIFYKKPEILDY